MKNNLTLHILYAAITFFLQNILNKFFYQEISLKSARIKLIGKVLEINLQELSQPLIFIFSKQQIDITNKWHTTADCIIKTALVSLVHLKDKRQLSVFINNKKIIIEGDIQILHHLLALFEAIPWDPAHYLAPYIGDIMAEAVTSCVKKGLIGINVLLNQKKEYFKDILMEEFLMFPNKLEVLSFTNKVHNAAINIIKLERRLVNLEEKYEAGRT